jgi:thymidylate synthase
MVLPPCHYGFQVYTRELSLEERYQLALPIWKEKYGPLADMMVPSNIDNTPYKIPTRAISLMWNQRSVDTPLGLPFNIASYALLLMMIADEVNMVPDQLIGNLGDCHIYLDQVDGVKEQLTRQPMSLPKVTIQDGIYCSSPSDVLLENYESHPAIKFPLSN